MFKEHNVSTAMKPINKIRSAVVQPKDKIPKEKQNELIYRIPCKNCDFVYIGETGRSLEKRLAEHKDNVNKNTKQQYTRATRKASQTEINKSAITDHINQHKHLPDWEKTKVLGRESK